MIGELIYNGVQRVAGHTDQWVFTDLITGATFQTDVGISDELLLKEVRRVRRKFADAADKATRFGRTALPRRATAYLSATHKFQDAAAC